MSNSEITIKVQNYNGNNGFINWDIIKDQQIIKQTKYFNHIRFKKPTIVEINTKTISSDNSFIISVL